jgi:hypothetical protein
MERQTDNNVFVVGLGQNPMVPGQTHTWIDVVERDKCYFHPVGNHWPVQPPNYIGFPIPRTLAIGASHRQFRNRGGLVSMHPAK